MGGCNPGAETPGAGGRTGGEGRGLCPESLPCPAAMWGGQACPDGGLRQPPAHIPLSSLRGTTAAWELGEGGSRSSAGVGGSAGGRRHSPPERADEEVSAEGTGPGQHLKQGDKTPPREGDRPQKAQPHPQGHRRRGRGRPALNKLKARTDRGVAQKRLRGWKGFSCPQGPSRGFHHLTSKCSAAPEK